MPGILFVQRSTFILRRNAPAPLRAGYYAAKELSRLKFGCLALKEIMKFILGKKIEMAQMFIDDKVIPVTLVQAGPCFVAQIKTKDKDGYEGVQIGFEKMRDNKVNKPMKDKPYKYLREFQAEPGKMKINDKIDVSIFEPGDKVKVSGISKGKGFQGAVKRWGFHGRDATHGTKHEERTLGSVGATGPQRVFKGKKMPGRMGADRKTIKNLKIVQVDAKNNILAIKGAIPGRRNTLLQIQSQDKPG